MSWRSCGNRWRRVSYIYNFAGVLDLNAFATLAARLMNVGARAEDSSCPSRLWQSSRLIDQPSSSAPASAAVSCFSLDTGPRLEY